MDMVKVLFITEDYPSGLNGTSVKTRYTLQHLLQNNYQIDLCCAHHQTKLRPIADKNLKTFCVKKRYPSKLSWANFRRKIQIFFSFEPSFVRQLYSARLEAVIKRLHQQQEYDFLIFDGFSTLIYDLSSSAEKIYIDDEDMTILFKRRAAQTTNLLKKIFYKLDYWRSLNFESRFLSKMDQVWAISPKTAQRLAGLTQAETSLMPTYLPLNKNLYQPTSTDLVFTGTLSWEENICGLKWFLIEHWSQIHQQLPQLKLHIIGREAGSDLKAFLYKFPQVKYWGYVENLEDVYQNCALAIAPVLINAGIKVKILTYMSYGLPVVATPTASLGLVSTQGLTIAQPAEFAQSVIKLISFESRRSKQAIEAYQNIKENYSAEHLTAFVDDHLG